MKESEYQKAGEEVRKQITALLEAKGFDFSDKEENGTIKKTKVITQIDNDEYNQGYGLNIYKCFYNIQYQISTNSGASVSTLFPIVDEPFVEVKYAKGSGSSCSGGSRGVSKPTPTPTSTPDNEQKDDNANNTNKVNYKMIVGNNNTWSYGKSKNLVFCSNANFADFVSVSVDGEVINKENYNAKSGSTIIELKESYLKTLKEGIHKISINSKTGSAEANFKIEKTSETKLTKLPQTGSTMKPIIITLFIILILNIGVTGVMYYKAKTY